MSLGYYKLMAVLVTILGISLLILFHELGHYLVARACGMRVLRFSIGFGPRLLGFQIGETMWQLAAVPLGGFVQIDGMGPREPDAPVADERCFRNRPSWQRALVLAAGPSMNWLLAVFFVAVLAYTVGFVRYDLDTTIIGTVNEGPAAEAGMQAGDRVLSVAGKSVSDWRELVAAVQKQPTETLAFEIERDGTTMTLEITPRRTADGLGGGYRIEVDPPGDVLKFGFFGATATGFVGAWSLTEQQLGLLWGLITRTERARLTGLPGIIKIVSARAKKGLRWLLEALAGLSITLALLNLLPIPALDGSRLVFVGIEAVRRRPVDQKIEAVIHGIGFLILLGLMIFVSIRDLVALL